MCSHLSCGNKTLWGRSENSSFPTRLFSGQVSSIISTLIWLTAGHCVQGIVGRLRTSSSLLWHCLPAPHAGNFTELLPSASLKHQPSQGRESAVCKQKALGRSHSAALWQYWRSLAGGNNVYLMVSTICIYINSNTAGTSMHCAREIWREKNVLIYKCTQTGMEPLQNAAPISA